jgi:hypothetical protein
LSLGLQLPETGGVSCEVGNWRRRCTLPATLRAPCEKRESGAAGAPVESTPLIPAPPVEVIDPSESVPSAATFKATIELLAALVIK